MTVYSNILPPELPPLLVAVGFTYSYYRSPFFSRNIIRLRYTQHVQVHVCFDGSTAGAAYIRSDILAHPSQ